MKRIKLSYALALVAVLVLGATAAQGAINPTSLGFRANVGGGGNIDIGWTGGNLGNTWHEGEWVPYELVLTNVQSSYPNLVGMPDIQISYDFTSHDVRFVDLVRGIQVGQVGLSDTQGWPQDDGSPYPLTTPEEIENAQRDVGNNPPLDNVWQLGGGGNFQLLNLPDSQINRDLDLSDGTPTSARKIFVVTANDLLNHGIPPTANTIVIYYQLHESRTFLWGNSLQSAYDAAPTNVWGGYLYGAPPFSTDQRNGSSSVPGSSGHIHLETLSGSQDVPIPIPPSVPGLVSGLKWRDDNGNAVQDGGEPTLSGWRIEINGEIEGIPISFTQLTDGSGNYSFPNLTSATWTVHEANQREVPPETGYNETYPNAGSPPVGEGTVVPVNDPSQGPFGWQVELTDAVPAQGDLNFGNRQCFDVTATPLTPVTVCPGSQAQFCTVPGGTGPFTYAWTHDGVTIPGAADSCYTIASASAGDAGQYCVTVTGQCGDPVTQCATLTVNVNVDATNLNPLTVCPGDQAQFCTTASGTGPFTYSWTHDGVTIPGANGNCYTIASASAGDAGQYCVTVTGACGPPVQRCATLTVNVNVDATNLNPLTVCPGDQAQFCTTASGTGPFTYSWTHDGVTIPGANGNCYTIASATAGDAGQYCVTVTGACGPPVQRCATLTVNVNVDATELTPLTVCPGAQAQFCTTASGTGPFTYGWTHDGVTIPGANGNCYTIASASAGDAGQYCVTVTGTCGPPVTRCATLTVNENISTTDLVPLTVCPGDQARFCTTPSGTGPFTYAWTHDGVAIPGAADSCYTVASASAGDAGVYCVTVTGACGAPVQTCATLTVNVNVDATNLNPLTVCPGSQAQFCTTASGTGPFTYSWTHDGVTIPGATGNCYTIASASAGDAGQYCVTVTGACGPPVQRCATLTVNQNVDATELTPLTVCPGAEAQFCTTASGTGPFTYSWTHDGVTIPGATGNCYTIASASAGDAGQYCVTVTGACGSPVQRCATLTVNQNVDATPLTSLQVCAGDQAQFCTTASGTGPFTYSWTHDGVTIPGATGNCYTIASTSTGDAGQYCVTVTGACGDPVTQCADLVVNNCEQEYCGFTQGFYGNSGGSWNGMGTFAIIDMLITPGNPLVVGKPGRSVTFADGTEACIISRLPASGPASTLPIGLGDVAIDPSTCQTSPPLPLQNGRFRNVLLGQTITLSLNTRYDTDLGSLELCPTMVTQASLPGPDGIHGTDDDVLDPGPDGILGTADDPIFVILIPPSVLGALDNLGLSRTVADLLELANRALAGEPTGGASLAEINNAVDGINRGFDQCRFLIECSTGVPARPYSTMGPQSQGQQEEQSFADRPTQFMLHAASPNPMRNAVSFGLDLPERSQVRLAIYDISGRVVTTLIDGVIDAGYQTVAWSVSRSANLPGGVYFYRADVQGLDSRQHYTETRKLTILR